MILVYQIKVLIKKIEIFISKYFNYITAKTTNFYKFPRKTFYFVLLFIFCRQKKKNSYKNINCIKTASVENAVLSVFFGFDLKNLDIINLEGVVIFEKIL